MQWQLVICAYHLTLFTKVWGMGWTDSLHPRDSSGTGHAVRELSAANRNTHLDRKAEVPSSLFNQEAVLHYFHEAEDVVFEASLFVKSQEPILVLEDLDSDLYSVICSKSEIALHFASPAALDQVLRFNQSFFVVTSHDTCNSDGHRATYRAGKVVFDPEENAAHISVSRCEWHDAFSDTRVSFIRRHAAEKQLYRRRAGEGRQEALPTSTVVSTTTKVFVGSSTPTVVFPTVSSVTGQPSATATQVLNVSMVNESIFPPQFPLANQLIPQGIQLSCKNCTIGGTVEISEASFQVPASGGTFTGDVNATIAFFEHGSVDIDATGLFAHLELEVDVSLTQAKQILNISLPGIPLSPFVIPGVATFGPLVQPELDVAISLAESLSFTYGMDITVPDHSKLHINMSDFANSSVIGFPGTKVQPIPLQATAPLLSLLLSVTFKPQVLLGVSTFVGSVTGGIGGFLSLPTLAVNITELGDVDKDCNPLPNATSGDSLNGLLSNIRGNFTNIVPDIELNVGAIAKFDAAIGPFTESAATQVVIASTAFSLPTLCLEYDAAKQTYGTPTVSPSPTASGSSASASATGTGSVSDHKSTGAILQHDDNAWLMQAAGLAAALVSVGFLGWA